MSRQGPVSFSYPSWRDFEDSVTPAQVFDESFGMEWNAEDLVPWSFLRGPYFRPRQLYNHQHGDLSEVQSDNYTFKVNLDVDQFAPNELTVKTVDNTVIVHGKQSDQHGLVCREFTRRYVLPDDVKPDTVTSALSLDGDLTIEAPKKGLEVAKPVERSVPIIQREAPVFAQVGRGTKE